MKERWRKFVESIQQKIIPSREALVIPLTPNSREFIEGLRQQCQLQDFSSTATAAFILLAWAQDKVNKGGRIVAINPGNEVGVMLDWPSLMKKAQISSPPFDPQNH